MKILITGGAGFIGSNIADRLIDEGYAVAIVDNLSNGKKENINKKAVFYQTDGLGYIALRYANIYGPRQDPLGEAGVVAIFSNKIIRGENPVINGDGNQTRDYVYVKDVVAANISAIKSSFTGCVNIGTSSETTVNELFNILKQASGNNDIAKTHGPEKPGEAYRSSLDCRLAKKVLGWRPETSVKDGLDATYAWFYKNMS